MRIERPRSLADIWRRNRQPALRALGVAMAIAWSGATPGAQTKDYIVGARDVLTVTIWNEPELSGDFAVASDGSCMLPLIGSLEVGGQPVSGIEQSIQERLADGFFKEPRVSVAVKEYRSQRVFVVGQVRSPGSFPLTGEMTLIEALALAGSTTPNAGRQLVITRPSPGAAGGGPLLPSEATQAEVFYVDLVKLQSGKVPNTVQLQDGDTIFVPEVERVFVFGHVAGPGAYSFSPGTTVRQLLSLAGGVTDRGAIGRTKIVRLLNGEETEVDAELTDLVQPGDTIVVPARYF